MDNENQRELDVLAALEGIHRMQESIRDTELDMVVETGIIFLRLHYQRLPPGVARRLTEISPRDVAEVSEVIRENGATPEQRRSLGDRLASDAAVAQVIRAANVYRGAAGLRSPRAGRLAGGGDMSERARKAGQFAGAVERLAVELAMVEIIQARRFLGKPTSKKDREELLKLTTPELASAAQALGAAVHLRQQMEIAEFTRGLIEQQKAAQEPQGGPLPC